ncbi:MAG: aminopeptidase [Planctomycetota bacterium]
MKRAVQASMKAPVAPAPCRSRLLVLLLLVVAAPLLSGCYYMQAIAGQGEIIFSSRPITEVIDQREREMRRLERLTPVAPDSVKLQIPARIARLRDDVARLQLIGVARRYAHESLGLVENDNYTVYFETGGRHRYPTFVVTAAKKTKLEPVLFNFPVVGNLPYKGFFIRKMALDLERELEAKGYDAGAGPTMAFSTLGWFTDPVFTPMLSLDEIELPALIFHELLHATAYHPTDSDFNESLATFFERYGVLQFLEERHGADAAILTVARNRFADKDAFSALVERMRDDLKALYESDISDEEKLCQRQDVFVRYQQEYVTGRRTGVFRTSWHDWFPRIRLDNAKVLSLVRYIAGLDLYESVWNSLGKDFRLTIPVFREAARAESPRGYLVSWLFKRSKYALPD